jgi:hypothetical protein
LDAFATHRRGEAFWPTHSHWISLEHDAGSLGILSQQALTNIYERWLKVLDLIEEGEGSSHLVEKKRGRFFSAPSDEAEMVEGANDEEDEDADYWEEDNAEEDEDW